MKYLNGLLPSLLLASGCPHHEQSPIEIHNGAPFVAPVLAQIKDMEQMALSDTFRRVEQVDTPNGFHGFLASRSIENGRQDVFVATKITPEQCTVSFGGSVVGGDRWQLAFSINDNEGEGELFTVRGIPNERLRCMRRDELYFCVYGSTETAYDAAPAIGYINAPELQSLSVAMEDICEKFRSMDG